MARTHARAVAATVVLAAAVAACGSGAARPVPHSAQDAPVALDRAPVARSLRLATVSTGLVRPTWAGAAPGHPGALWVAEQPGRLLRLAGGRRTVVADLRAAVSVGAERGLLGVAFHPGFAENRRLFVDVTDRRGDTRVVELRVDPGGRARRVREVLHVAQPEENHNGGGLAFGPDERLYVGMGDGGGAFDPRDRAQDPASPLGKLLAIDVDAPGRPRWKAVLTGLRNPWRFWLDFALNQVWIGDVGQDRVEELDRVELEFDEPAKNLGWPRWEGDRPFPGRRLRGRGHVEAPVAVYTHAAGCSITAGPVYRGTAVPALDGRAVLGDFCSGRLWSVRPDPDGSVSAPRVEAVRVSQLTHIGTDAAGELLLATADGRLLRATR